MSKSALARRLTVAFFAMLFVPVVPAWAAPNEIVAQGLNDPRGIATGNHGGRVLVAQTGSGEITEIFKWKRGTPTISAFATVPGANDVAFKGFGSAYVTVSGPPEAGGDPVGQVVRVQRGGPTTVVADIATYQQEDPDPQDQEGDPAESNPTGLALLRRRGILVADAANNDLLRVGKDGSIETVARFPVRMVPWPSGLPEGPPPGTLVPVESVPTAVAVGPDGAWYVSELSGFPFVKGASRIWRVEPGTRDWSCDESATTGPCRVFADGFTSVIDLTFAEDTLLVLELAKDGLLAVEMGTGPPIGALWAVEDRSKTEIAPGTLLAPGGVAVADEDRIYVTTGTLFGPGAGEVVRIDEPFGDDDDDDERRRRHGGKKRSHHGDDERRRHHDDD